MKRSPGLELNLNVESLQDLDYENFGFEEDDVAAMTPGDQEYDECLGLPDSVQVNISITGEPILIEKSHDVADTPSAVLQYVPFAAIHNPPVKFKSFQRMTFIGGEEIKVSIIDNERSITTHFLNPNLYTIEFRHGEYTWTVKKRFKHIHHLHQQLRMFRASLNIPFPTKLHKERRDSFKNSLRSPDKVERKKKSALPRFPSKPEVMVPQENLKNRMKQLEAYLYNLLNMTIYRTHPETIAFLEVSYLSFIRGLGMKGKEGLLQKRTGSTQPGQAGCNCLGIIQSSCCVRCNYFCKDFLCGSWRKRWFFVKETFFGYIRPKDGRLKSVVLFDQGFEIASGMYSTGLGNGLQIQTLCRQLTVKCWTKRKGKEWLAYMKNIANGKARDFVLPNEHGSFAPVRTNIASCWFVDGASYMEAVADALNAAEEEIFIADWWLSPEIYMKRRSISDEWRLDKILERKAKEGVKVFVLLYKEVEVALGIKSYYSKQKLVEGCPENIKVLRHPDHAKAGVFLWAHHEKIVVVDQTFAFVGGIDLCYGRWDDYRHRLTDMGSVSPSSGTNQTKKIITSSNPKETYQIKLPPDVVSRCAGDIDIPGVVPSISEPCPELSTPAEPPTPQVTEIPATPPLTPVTPTRPRLNLSLGDHLLVVQPLSDDMKCNTPEMERKNVFGIINNVKSKSRDWITQMISSGEPEGTELQCQVSKEKEEKVDNFDELSGSAKLWIGKDYTNFIVKDFTDLHQPFIDLFDRSTTPRMPWHDVGVFVHGSTARDVARHFIQRWNATKLEKARLNNTYPYLLPKSYDEECKPPDFLLSETTNVSCQVLRSASSWSAGFLDADHIEQSIHEAYIDSISKAQHYIYIENQFFITASYENINVRNQIHEALYKRIMRAYRENAVFRVFVVMPLLPGFEGEVGGATGTALHAVTHWNYASISRGKDSLLERLKGAGIKDPNNYIIFCGLRTHSELNGEPVTELIYVHSKLMIIDDKVVICGSANINDRSLLGKRDSEIAVIIQDESFDDGIMNGNSFPSGKYAGGLRKYLFKEHLGILGHENESYIDIEDPIIEHFYRNVWWDVASLNTELYEKVFHCIPSDKVDSFAALKGYLEQPPLYHTEVSRSAKMLEDIRGHLVLLPLNFLCNEVLTPQAGTVEGIMPTALWT